MAQIAPALRLPLVRTFDTLHKMLSRPTLYAIPWQTPAGLTYDNDVDAWLDGSSNVVTKDPADLTYYAIPALWGADAEAFTMNIGGLSDSGDLVGIAKASYSAQLTGSMMVVTGSLTGDRYTIGEIENAPDGGAAVFVVVQLRRRDG